MGGGGAVKTDKDFCPRNGPKRFELQLFRAFDVYLHGHFVTNRVASVFFLIACLQVGIQRST